MAERKERLATEKLISVSLCAALALISGLLENKFPLPFPGMRLGIANIFVLVALVTFGAREAAMVASLKIALALVFTGNHFAFACSLAGTALSLPLSIALYTYCGNDVSVPAISVAAAVAFNIGQIAAVSALVSQPMLLGYLPFLVAAACATGFAVGTVADRLSLRLRPALGDRGHNSETK